MSELATHLKTQGRLKVTTLSSVWTVDVDRKVYTRSPRFEPKEHPWVSYEPGEHPYVNIAPMIIVGLPFVITLDDETVLRSGSVVEVEQLA